MSPARRLYAVLAATAVAVAGALGAVAPAQAEDPRTVALVGDLQDEAGCPGDWDPACDATELTQVGTTSTYEGVFDLPGGSYQYKVAINDGWAENYGAGGQLDGANIPLVIGGTAALKFTYDDETHLVTVAPTELAGGATAADRALAGDSLRAPLTRERFYFVMADRFANGDPSNDTGGLTGGRSVTGLDPTDKAYYHGGDLAGLTGKLDYIKGLGTTAIWLTPSFKNKPVQGTGDNESAGYHGYWITDFTQVDPHLGTNAELKELIRQAHGKGMKVFFDIITNHTADVIDYEENQYSYRSKEAYPYLRADGTAFDDRDYVNQPFPEMNRDSFPYTPFFHSEEDATVKVPEWLNDPLLYHNRGDSTFAGESSTYGDFIGLDDLFTERPEVVEGMGEVYKAWVDFGVDGFRIDTVKHVNLEFWQKFVPEILGEADRIGNDDFFAFGEVYDGNPAVMSQYTTAGKLQATLDFGFQQQGVDFAKGNPATVLADFFAKDDWYTDADSNAYQLPTFLGNHDMGRVAMFLEGASADEAELLKRVELADSLMYTVRGNPVNYYGDEQGFIGTGGDQLAREDMFASQVDIYNEEDVLAGPEGSMDRYDTDHPIYQHLKALAAMRAKHPALADGAQVQRYAEDGAGIFAVSRIDATKGNEYLVVANNSTEKASATLDTWTVRGEFVPVMGAKKPVKPAKSGEVRVTVPPLSVAVYRGSAPMETKKVAAPTVEVSLPERGVSERAEISAEVEAGTFAQTTFLYRQVGAEEWTEIGVDDNAPYRVFHDVSGMGLGTLLEYRAVVEDAGGRVAADSAWTTVVEPVSSTVPQNGDPVDQPGTVAIAGTLDSELGCSADWQPDCPEAQMALDAVDQIWTKDVSIPAGTYSYKAALDESWTENYGDGAVRDGPNIDLDTPDGEVTFYYDHATHWVTSDENTEIITAPGSYQDELGCSGDWQPECMRPWLQDPDGDGVYALILTLPAGDWEFKVAHGLSWDESYGAGGGADNIPLSVPAGGAAVTFLYDSATHLTTVQVG